MKYIKLATILGAAAATAISASAGLYTDVNTHNTDLDGSPDEVEDTWNYGPIGAGETITQIKTWFEFRDDDSDGSETAYVIVGSQNPDDFQSSTFEVNDGTEPFTFSLLLPPNLTSWAALALDASNGSLSYIVERVSGDFILKKAGIEVTTATASVPDEASTVVLLGLGLIGLFVARRRKS